MMVLMFCIYRHPPATVTEGRAIISLMISLITVHHLRIAIDHRAITRTMSLLQLLYLLSTVFIFGHAFSFSSISSTPPHTTSSSSRHGSSNSLHHKSSASVLRRYPPPRRQDVNIQLHYLRQDDEDYITNNQGIIIDNAKRASRYLRRERLRQQRIQRFDEQHRLLDWMEQHAHYYQDQGDEIFATSSQPPLPLPLPTRGAAPISPLLVNTPIPIINFRTNSDFPASTLPPSHWFTHALPPLPFEDAKYSNCVTLRGDVGDEVVGSKRIRILVPCLSDKECLVDDDDGVHQNSTPTTPSTSSVVDSSSSCVYIDGVKYSIQTMNEGEGIVVVTRQQKEAANEPATVSGRTGVDEDNNDDKSQPAYWLQSKLHNAIYGQVRQGTVLQRLEKPIVIKNLTTVSNHTQDSNEEIVEWMATSTSVAIKQMSWDTILSQRGKLAEDPITEVAAMQYLQEYVSSELHRQQQQLQLPMVAESTINEQQQHHIMMPLDLLSDDEYLYSITPFCTGGRLLDILENKSRFSEPEARYWMRQILMGLSCLKKAGVAHRDMSPENLMVHKGNVYIIDMGMSLRIPSLQNTNGANYEMQHHHFHHHPHPQQRSLILPQSPCGKWYYLSPEVCLSEQPFDGPAVDLWAAGVILFIMLTGLPPWEEPKMSDENFRLMTTGHLMRLLTERRVGLSVDVMDLMQRMFWYDPADRLSLEQVCAHPWITHEKYNIPA